MSRTAAVSEPIGESSPLELELPIGGMTCTNCAQRIEQELASQQGVTEASVSFATRRARIVGHEEVPGELAGRAAAAVGSLGYSVLQPASSPGAAHAAATTAQRDGEAGLPAAEAGISTRGSRGLRWHDWPAHRRAGSRLLAGLDGGLAAIQRLAIRGRRSRHGVAGLGAVAGCWPTPGALPATAAPPWTP